MKQFPTAAIATVVFVAASKTLGQCDPVLSGQLIASDPGTNDFFGYAGAIDGGTAIIGSYSDSNANGTRAGSAYVFVKEGQGWTQQAKLLASEGWYYSYFGMAVAVHGDIAVIGAPGALAPGGLDAGIVYVFVRNNGTWAEHTKLFPTDAKPGDYFGWSIAFDGETAVVGAPYANSPGNLDAGAAYVFVRKGNIWTQQAKLAAPDGASGDNFGWAVALRGDTTVIGSLNADATDAPNAGAAYVFVRDGQGWAQQAKLAAIDGAADDCFGFSLAIFGETAIVGAPNRDTPAGKEAGRAYVFERASGVWTERAALDASGGAPAAYFGWSIAVEDDVAVVGATYANADGGFQAGAVYAFTRANGAWTQRAKLQAPDGKPFDQFGASAALSTGTAVFGAIYDDPSDKSNAGSAYVFDLNCPPCYVDCDGSGELDIDDFICFQTLFGLGDLGADCDRSGELDIDDFICFQTAFGVGCP